MFNFSIQKNTKAKIRISCDINVIFSCNLVKDNFLYIENNILYLYKFTTENDESDMSSEDN